MNYDAIVKWSGVYLEGTWVLAKIFFLTLAFALPLGLLIAVGRGSKNPFIWRIFHYYIAVFRGTPLILQLIVVFYAPSYIFGINLDRFAAAVMAFVFNYAAYFAEIYRGGINSIPRGQYEAAQVLGFSRIQTFLKIISPQMVKRIALPMSNEFTTLVKDTALVSTLAVVELYRSARNAAAATTSIIPLFAAGAVYLVLNYFVTRFFIWFEKRLDYYR
ncbi:MAG: amino acid ABC transporter permease [Deferribacteraceae bacterium]|jgi:polar amino acid transport system permease protein|nr:amino acid ABC transporter permease [Deferribacteraceae bacterium]